MVKGDQQATDAVFFQERLEVLESTQNREAQETFADLQAVIINKADGLNLQVFIVQ
jgi:hypothetical protein